MNAQVEDETGEQTYTASLKFRGQTADEAKAAAADEAAADEAVEAIQRALDGRRQ